MRGHERSAGGPEGAQTWSPIIEISTWFPQLEHFMDGMKADSRDMLAMIAASRNGPRDVIATILFSVLSLAFLVSWRTRYSRSSDVLWLWRCTNGYRR